MISCVKLSSSFSKSLLNTDEILFDGARNSALYRGATLFRFSVHNKKMMAEIQSMDNKLLRLMGFLAMFGGLIAVWYATRLP